MCAKGRTAARRVRYCGPAVKTTAGQWSGNTRNTISVNTQYINAWKCLSSAWFNYKVWDKVIFLHRYLSVHRGVWQTPTPPRPGRQPSWADTSRAPGRRPWADTPLWADTTPKKGWLLQRVVCILLECILGLICLFSFREFIRMTLHLSCQRWRKYLTDKSSVM